MNQIEFLKLLSKQTNEPLSICKNFLSHTKLLIKEICYKGETIKFRGFGRFFLKEHLPRRIFNPQTRRYYYSKNKIFVDFAPAKKVVKQR